MDDRGLAALQAILGGDTSLATLDALVRDTERHRASVGTSLQAGVESALPRLVAGFAGRGRRHRALDAAFGDALTIVYRILFLLFAEARGLVPQWHPAYRESYTIESLRPLAEGGGSPGGLWESLQAISRLAHRGCTAGSLRLVPFNGRLFAPSAAPLAETLALDDRLVRDVLLAVTTRPGTDRRVRISYADLGVEQLGAVYERVLDYAPAFERESVSLGSVRAAEDDRHLLYAAVDDRVSRPPHARSACADANAGADPHPADRRSRDGQRRVSRGRLPLSRRRLRGGARSPKGPSPRQTSRLPIGRRSAARSPSAASTAWISTPRPSSSPASRSGSARSRPIVRSRFSIITCAPATAWWGRGWTMSRGSRPAVHGGRASAPLPLFDEDDLAPRLARTVAARLDIERQPDDSAAVVRAKERAVDALNAADGPLGTWRRLADAWCSAWFWPGEVERLTAKAWPAFAAVLRGAPDELPRGVSDAMARGRARGRGPRTLLSLGAGVPRSVLRRRRFAAARCRLRRGDRESAVGGGARADRLLARIRVLHAARIGSRQPLSVVRGAHAAARRAGRPRRHAHAVRAAGRSRVRRAPRVPVRSLRDRRQRRLRQSRRASFPIHRGVRFSLLTATKGGSTPILPAISGWHSPDGAR